jgi:hypothetical protein
MALRDQIRQTEEYREIATTAEQPASEAVAQAQGQAAQAGDGTVGEALGPVLNWEKSDMEFWLQVGQFVVLLLILRRLGRQQ